jgi:hypothetical protein
MIKEASLVEFFILDDSLTPNPATAAASDALSFRESLTSGVSFGVMLERLLYSDSMAVEGFSIFNLAFADTLTYTEEILPRASLESFADWLGFLDYFEVGLTNLQDTHQFDDLLEVAVSKGLIETHSWSDLLEYFKAQTALMLDTLQFTDQMVIQCPKFPLIPEASEIILTNGSDTITLPMPIFGNSDTLSIDRINRRSRGNDLIIAGVPGWKPIKLQRFEWDYLREVESLKLMEFMKRNLGQRIAVQGIYSDLKYVVFLKPDAELSQIGRDNRTITLDMQEVQPP